MNIGPCECGGVIVTLSQRNLAALVEAVARGGDDIPALTRETEVGHLTVVVEPDDIHYANRLGHPAGQSKN